MFADLCFTRYNNEDIICHFDVGLKQIVSGIIFLLLLLAIVTLNYGTVVNAVKLHLKSTPIDEVGGIVCRGGRAGQLKQNETFDDAWHVLISVSEGFDDMYLNWWRWFQRLNISLPVTMVAEDANTWNKYKHSTDLFDVCKSHDQVEEKVGFRMACKF